METLFAIAVAAGMLRAHATPPAEPPQVIATEQRVTKAEKPKPRSTPEPSLGF